VIQPDVPVLAVTAFASEEDRRRTIEHGFHEHIAKPFDPQKLISAVKSALSTK
jgi:CheY-like chemotaxis protein